MNVSRRDPIGWRKHILKAHVVRSRSGLALKVHSDVLLMLVAMSFYLYDDLRYSRGRRQLADQLGVSEATIQRWLREAVEAGLLARLSAGYQGHNAVYQALFPELVTGAAARKAQSLRGKIGRPKAKKGDPQQAAQHGEPPLKVSNKDPDTADTDELNSPGPPPF